MSASSISVSKRAWFLGAPVLAALLVGLIYFSTPSEPGQPTTPPAPVAEPPNRGPHPESTTEQNSPAPQSPSTLPPHPQSLLLGTNALGPEAQIELLAGILAVFRESHGAYPTAEDNRGVVRQLLGQNKARRTFLSPESPAISPDGTLLDARGNAYHFHFISSQQVELRSAGTDGELYTEDDLLFLP